MNLPDNTLLQGGKYRIIRFISSGGFGCTYEAELVLLHKRVAIKEFFVKDFCNRDVSNSHVTVATQSKVKLIERLKKKFIEEASALFSMQHPNIVRVTDVFEENSTAYYVMDYINGQSLQDIVKGNGALGESQAVGYIKQVAEALKYVHGLNRLHLDVKPGNIMIDDNNQAILIDFGASKQYDEVDGENTSTLLGKTPGYAPLEQIGNEVAKFLPATDIYALGATLYKLLTGVNPVSATQLASGETLEPIPSTISKSTRNAIAAAMEINKNKRPQSIDEFLPLLGREKQKTVVPEGKKSEDNSVSEELSEDTVLECEEEIPVENKDQSYYQSTEKKYSIEQVVDPKKKSFNKKIWGGICWVGVLLALICFINTSQGPEQVFTKANEYYDKKDYKKAIDLYLEAATKGYAPAQGQLGFLYYNGLGVTKDYAKAAEWYTKSAEQGNARAQCNLGYMYDNGQGVSQDYAKAVEWYTKSAEQGDATAQCNLGNMYYNGQGVSQDYAKAAEWYTKSAEQGNARAQCNLGYMYDNGQGVSQDYAKAVEWYTKAAEQGYAPAQCNLGYMYYNGQGVSQDYAKAVEWYTKSAEQGDATAQYNLGLMYESGTGISQDYVKAFELFSKAAEQGVELAENHAIFSKRYVVVYGKNSMGSINNYKYVDIGLSVKWATHNIGANYPYDFGDYYSWGETSTKAKYGIDYSNIKELSSKDISGSSMDVVHNKWGGTWRMPTKSEFIELKDKCDWEWFDENKIKGYIITGPNGNSIFLPAGDSKTEISYMDKNSGDYWSSTSNDDNSAFALSFGKEYLTEVRPLRFGYGLTIRPVSN